MKSDWSPNDLCLLSLGEEWSCGPQIREDMSWWQWCDESDSKNVPLTISTAKWIFCCPIVPIVPIVPIDRVGTQSFLPLQHAIENWSWLPRVCRTQRRRSNLGRLPGNCWALPWNPAVAPWFKKKDECDTSMTQYDWFKSDSSMISIDKSSLTLLSVPLCSVMFISTTWWSHLPISIGTDGTSVRDVVPDISLAHLQLASDVPPHVPRRFATNHRRKKYAQRRCAMCHECNIPWMQYHLCNMSNNHRWSAVYEFMNKKYCVDIVLLSPKHIDSAVSDCGDDSSESTWPQRQPSRCQLWTCRGARHWGLGVPLIWRIRDSTPNLSATYKAA